MTLLHRPFTTPLLQNSSNIVHGRPPRLQRLLQVWFMLLLIQLHLIYEVEALHFLAGVTGIATCSFPPKHNTLIGCCSSSWPASCCSSWIVHLLWSIYSLPECLWARESSIWPRDTELKESVCLKEKAQLAIHSPLTATKTHQRTCINAQYGVGHLCRSRCQLCVERMNKNKEQLYTIGTIFTYFCFCFII